MFSNRFKYMVWILMVCCLAGCGYKEISTPQRDVAYLKFKKSAFKSYTVLVNEKYQFKLGACQIQEDDTNATCQDPAWDKRYEVPSGKITVAVTDDQKNILIFRKEIFLGLATTKELILP